MGKSQLSTLKNQYATQYTERTIYPYLASERHHQPSVKATGNDLLLLPATRKENARKRNTTETTNERNKNGENTMNNENIDTTEVWGAHNLDITPPIQMTDPLIGKWAQIVKEYRYGEPLFADYAQIINKCENAYLVQHEGYQAVETPGQMKDWRFYSESELPKVKEKQKAAMEQYKRCTIGSDQLDRTLSRMKKDNLSIIQWLCVIGMVVCVIRIGMILVGVL